MMSTDHLPLGRVWNTQAGLNLEGLDLMDKVTLTAAQFTAVEANGRTWLAAWHLVAGPYGNQAQRSAPLITSKTFREVFGNPEVITKGVLAKRIYIDATMASRWGNAASYNNCCLWVNSTPCDGYVMTAIPVGEHFLEFTIDFVNKEVRTYLNGNLFNTYANANLTLDSTVSWGMYALHAQTSSSMIVALINDVYVTYDNQDGKISGRLGAVKCLPMPVDQIDLPAGWTVEDDPAQFYPYPLTEGGTWNAHQIMPRTPSEMTIKGQWSHSSVPVMSAGTLQTMFVENGQYGYWNSIVATTQIVINTAFERAKKVSGYAIQSYLAQYGVFNNWTFEASNDGTSWTVLDTRNNQGNALNVTYAIFAYKIPVDKVGSYKFYRLNVTNILIGSAAPQRCSLRHYTLLGDPADVKLNLLADLPSRPSNADGTDLDYPLLRGALNSSDAVVSFKVPDIGTADILAVRVSATQRRDQGANEILTVRPRVGADEGAPREVALKAHAENFARLVTYRQSADGSDWTKEKLANFRLVVNSKRGA